MLKCVELVMTSGVSRISEWGWGLAGVWGRNPQLPEAIGCLGPGFVAGDKGVWERSPSAGR